MFPSSDRIASAWLGKRPQDHQLWDLITCKDVSKARPLDKYIIIHFLLQCKLLLLFHTSFFNKKFVGKMFAARPAWVKKIIMTSYFFSFFCKKKETIKIIFQSLDSYQLLNVVEIFLIMMICFGLRLHVLTQKKFFSYHGTGLSQLLVADQLD